MGRKKTTSNNSEASTSSHGHIKKWLLEKKKSSVTHLSILKLVSSLSAVNLGHQRSVYVPFSKILSKLPKSKRIIPMLRRLCARKLLVLNQITSSVNSTKRLDVSTYRPTSLGTEMAIACSGRDSDDMDGTGSDTGSDTSSVSDSSSCDSPSDDDDFSLEDTETEESDGGDVLSSESESSESDRDDVGCMVTAPFPDGTKDVQYSTRLVSPERTIDIIYVPDENGVIDLTDDGPESEPGTDMSLSQELNPTTDSGQSGQDQHSIESEGHTTVEEPDKRDLLLLVQNLNQELTESRNENLWYQRKVREIEELYENTHTVKMVTTDE